MTVLSFGEVMVETYPAIAGPEGEEAYLEYRTKIRELDNLERLTEGDVQELVAGSVIKDRLPAAVEKTLAGTISLGPTAIKVDGRTFEPGASAIIAESGGKIRGVHHQPNDDETLSSYGNGLLWAAMKLGDESYAYANGTSTADMVDTTGYRAVCKVLTGKQFKDVPFKDRPHLGGATLDLTKRPGHGNQGPLLHAGVSGVLLTTPALYAMLNHESLKLLYRHAQFEGADENFVGNIFAGSIDSSIGSLILQEVCNMPQPNEVDMAATVSQFIHGVNPH